MRRMGARSIVSRVEMLWFGTLAYVCTRDRNTILNFIKLFGCLSGSHFGFQMSHYPWVLVTLCIQFSYIYVTIWHFMFGISSASHKTLTSTHSLLFPILYTLKVILFETHLHPFTRQLILETGGRCKDGNTGVKILALLHLKGVIISIIEQFSFSVSHLPQL